MATMSSCRAMEAMKVAKGISSGQQKGTGSVLEERLTVSYGSWKTNGRAGSIVCSSAEKGAAGRIAESRKYQMQATELLAELLKAKDVQKKAEENIDALTEEFFTIASTYLDLARKEGNAEVVTQLETTLKITMAEKEKTLRPEIRLLNQLLRDTSFAERSRTIDTNLPYLSAESYFFTLLSRMVSDVERQKGNAQRTRLLLQLRTIQKETKEASRALKAAAKSLRYTKDAP